MIKIRGIIFCLIIFLTGSGQSFSQPIIGNSIDSDNKNLKPDSNLNGIYALGILAIPEYQGSRNNQIVPLLFARVNYKKYYLQSQGLGFRVNISNYNKLEYGPTFNYRIAREDNAKNDQIAKLRPVDNVFEGGFFVRSVFRTIFDEKDSLAFDFNLRRDINSVYNGFTANFGFNYNYVFSRSLRAGFGLDTNYADGNFNDTYFSIDNNNSKRSGLQEFDAKSGINSYGASFNISYALNRKWGITSIVRASRLVNDAKNSPIVKLGSKNVFLYGVGFSRRF